MPPAWKYNVWNFNGVLYFSWSTVLQFPIEFICKLTDSIFMFFWIKLHFSLAFYHFFWLKLENKVGFTNFKHFETLSFKFKQFSNFGKFACWGVIVTKKGKIRIVKMWKLLKYQNWTHKLYKFHCIVQHLQFFDCVSV